jgi:hypothetical protein
MLRRWRRRVHRRLGRVEGLVRVLMKPRNGEPWTEDDRAFLWRELGRIEWSPSLLLFHVPGLLPLLARLLDRRAPGSRRLPGGRRSGEQEHVGGAVG